MRGWRKKNRRRESGEIKVKKIGRGGEKKKKQKTEKTQEEGEEKGEWKIRRSKNGGGEGRDVGRRGKTRMLNEKGRE